MYKYAVAEASSRHAAQQLIRLVFVEELGFSGVGPDGFDEDATFLCASHGEVVVAAVRIVHDSERGLPLDKYVDLSSVRAQAAPIAEVSRLACHPNYREHGIVDRAVPWFIDVLRARSVQRVVIESLLKTAPYYQRFGFLPLGEPFLDPSVVGTRRSAGPNAVAMMLSF